MRYFVAGLVVLAAAVVVADSPFFACPPEATNGCEARVQAPTSPDVDRVCMRLQGSGVVPAVDDPMCQPTTPEQEVKIAFFNPSSGQGHQRYEVVACDDELGLCSLPAERLAIAVDLDVPSFFEVLRKALGGF